MARSHNVALDIFCYNFGIQEREHAVFQPRERSAC
jgi:hypothetical protein